MTTQILLSGFGGQGILFTGKFLAYKGLIEDKNVSWLPSYGPEMRGGTASCSVIVSDQEVGSPIISEPDVLIAMNLPSFEKFEPTVKAGGIVIADSSLIEAKSTRTDIDAYYIPATSIANEQGISTLANMIITGKLLKEVEALGFDGIDERIRPRGVHRLLRLRHRHGTGCDARDRR